MTPNPHIVVRSLRACIELYFIVFGKVCSKG